MRFGLALLGELSSTSGGFLYDRMLVDALRRGGDTVDVFPLPWKTPRRLPATLLSWKGDLLLQDELAHASLAPLNLSLRREAAFPVVSIVHHLKSSEDNRLRRLERAYLASVDGFVFNSRATMSATAKILGMPVAGFVAPPGGDRLPDRPTDEQIAARSHAPGPLRVLFVGNLIPRKGLHALVDALAILPRESWQLTVAGSPAMDPAYAARISRLVSERGLERQVLMTGFLEDAPLARALMEHHVLAVPSSYEGFGIVYLEAMGFGVVPLASSAGGGPEIVENEKSGLLVPPGDVPAIARALADLESDRTRLCVMARAARQRFDAFPGWEQSMTAARRHLHALFSSWKG